MTPGELKTLGRRCVTRYMQAEALRFEALRLLAEFERRQGWKTTPFPSTAEWFAGQVGITVGAAREQVRTALALEELPETSAAMQDGRLSYSKARALTRVSTPETEGALLELASRESAAELERTVRRMRVADLPAEERRYQSRRLRVWVDSEGMVEVRGRLDPETGQRLLRALEWAEDQVFRAAEDPTGTRPEQRKADALGVVAGRALDGGRTRGNGSGAGRARPLVMLHVDETVLKGEAPDAESAESDTRDSRSELEDGTRVSAETSRRLSCDAAVVRVGHGADGRVTGAGACTRTIPASVRRAVEARDRGVGSRGVGPGSWTCTMWCTGPAEARTRWTTWSRSVHGITAGCTRVARGCPSTGPGRSCSTRPGGRAGRIADPLRLAQPPPPDASAERTSHERREARCVRHGGARPTARTPSAPREPHGGRPSRSGMRRAS